MKCVKHEPVDLVTENCAITLSASYCNSLGIIYGHVGADYDNDKNNNVEDNNG